MNQRIALLTAAIFGMLSVAIGAFGAHALKAILLATGRTETYELAVRYQFYHTLALLATGILMNQFPSLKVSAWFFIAGIIFFSGSLFILALFNQPILGAVTPIGGVLLIAGWATMAWGVFRSSKF